MKFKVGDKLVSMFSKAMIEIEHCYDDKYGYVFCNGVKVGKHDWDYSTYIEERYIIVKELTVKTPKLTCKIEVQKPKDKSINQQRAIKMLTIEE